MTRAVEIIQIFSFSRELQMIRPCIKYSLFFILSLNFSDNVHILKVFLSESKRTSTRSVIDSIPSRTIRSICLFVCFAVQSLWIVKSTLTVRTKDGFDGYSKTNMGQRAFPAVFHRSRSYGWLHYLRSGAGENHKKELLWWDSE